MDALGQQALERARARVGQLRAQGVASSELASTLNAEGVPHPDGAGAEWNHVDVIQHLLDDEPTTTLDGVGPAAEHAPANAPSGTPEPAAPPQPAWRAPRPPMDAAGVAARIELHVVPPARSAVMILLALAGVMVMLVALASDKVPDSIGFWALAIGTGTAVGARMGLALTPTAVTEAFLQLHLMGTPNRWGTSGVLITRAMAAAYVVGPLVLFGWSRFVAAYYVTLAVIAAFVRAGYLASYEEARSQESAQPSPAERGMQRASTDADSWDDW